MVRYALMRDESFTIVSVEATRADLDWNGFKAPIAKLLKECDSYQGSLVMNTVLTLCTSGKIRWLVSWMGSHRHNEARTAEALPWGDISLAGLTRPAWIHNSWLKTLAGDSECEIPNQEWNSSPQPDMMRPNVDWEVFFPQINDFLGAEDDSSLNAGLHILAMLASDGSVMIQLKTSTILMCP
jgi:hypothetical protein